MPPRSLVNLDAMIPREDFALDGADPIAFESIQGIGLAQLKKEGEIMPVLRKPDFQRETNHWSPDQVVSLLECFVNGDLIPSVILWRSPVHLFVIDGGHRLSVLRAWVEDDYGDGLVSQAYFGLEISKEQQRVAKRARELVEARVGKYAQVNARRQLPNLPDAERRQLTTIASRALPIQWVTGDASKAEASFFRINKEGTPLDSVEELLLRNRRRPVAVAARAVIRAGKGHRYWSGFEEGPAAAVEKAAHALHEVLFEPEAKRVVKTLNLPLGGSKGVRTALEILIEFILIANRNQQGEPRQLDGYPDDETGESTLNVLKSALRLAGWMTGNDRGSLGLHPAVYFYGPTGVHSSPMFMGTVALIARRLANNDTAYFRKFTKVRSALEELLRTRKELFATILQKHISTKRTEAYSSLLAAIIDALDDGEEISDDWLVNAAGLGGKILSGSGGVGGSAFSDETKSAAFIAVALESALRCEECKGYLDPEKSISYDHNQRRRDGGKGTVENLRFMHPYCNQAVKN